MLSVFRRHHCFGDSFDSHLARLDEVLGRIKSAGLKVAPQKCQLLKDKVQFLGHVVSRDGISTDPQKVEAIADWPQPKTVSEVRSFVGLASYYRRFVSGFAEKARPLHRLTESKCPFIWSDECQDAFCQLKVALTSTPILGYPKSCGQYTLDTDASNSALGAVLPQQQDGVERVIGYFSKAFTKPERNYCVTRRELLAIVSSLKHFHHYLYGSHIIVRTDHGALRWLLSFKKPESQMARWLEVIGTYDLEIQHRAGRVAMHAR